MSITLDKKINFWTLKSSIILDVGNFDAAAFAKWLKQTREDVRPKLTLTAFADLAGISKQYASLLEKGDDHTLTQKPVQPALDKVERMAKVLKVDVNFVRELAGYEPFVSDVENYFKIAPGVSVLFEKNADFTPDQMEKFLETATFLFDGIKTDNKTFVINSNRVDMKKKYGAENVMTEDGIRQMKEEQEKSKKTK